MNGELHQICRITAAAKKALKSGEPISFVCEDFTRSIEFSFIKRKALANRLANSVEEWHKNMISLGVADYKLLSADGSARMFAGFSNALSPIIACFYKNQKPSYFRARWRYDRNSSGWHVKYAEKKSHDFDEIPLVSDPSKALEKTLIDIERLARDINENSFAEIFRDAREILNSENPKPRKFSPDLPPRYLRLFLCAERASVFGGMLSWNDSPLFAAQERGVGELYDKLSDALYRQIAAALLFAINES